MLSVPTSSASSPDCSTSLDCSCLPPPFTVRCQLRQTAEGWLSLSRWAGVSVARHSSIADLFSSIWSSWLRVALSSLSVPSCSRLSTSPKARLYFLPFGLLVLAILIASVRPAAKAAPTFCQSDHSRPMLRRSSASRPSWNASALLCRLPTLSWASVLIARHPSSEGTSAKRRDRRS